MDLVFLCGKCRAHLLALDREAGAETDCPKCGARIRIPQLQGSITCTACQALVAFAPDCVGEVFHCPQCQAALNPTGDLAPPRTQRITLKRSPPPPPRREEADTVKGKSGFSLLGAKAWCLVNCVTGESHVLEKFPYEIGSTEAVDLRLGGLTANHCALVETKSDGLCLAPRDEQAVTLLNGQELAVVTPLQPNNDYSLRVGAHYFLLRGGRNSGKWLRHLDFNRWVLQDPQTGITQPPQTLPELADWVASHDPDRSAVVYPHGAKMGFLLSHFVDALEACRRLTVTSGPTPDTMVPASVAPVANDGELTCPVCWLRFDKGDAMHIAQHESLRGDPVLGPDAMLRFQATRFNNQGQALDASALACPDIACPHCRRKLPPAFLDIPHRIFSIVGAPSAGKSYYLSVMAKVVPEALYRHFGVVFKDADPTGNAALNSMKNRLFTGASAEQVQLEKTQLEGVMYERVQRQGRTVALPKPFIFAVAPAHDGAARQAVVFYDNAGEHFEPGIDELSSPGAQHMAAAATIFFLFDPTVNAHFRARLSGHADPQLQAQDHVDQQETLLAEMEVRIKRLLGIDPRARISKPLAIVVGKCDVWLPLVGKEKLRPVIADGAFDQDAVSANSRILRGLLVDLCPSIVANAESLADEVMYFAVSAFGHSPVRLPSGGIGPEPGRLNPMFVETPILWGLQKTFPGLIPLRAATSRPPP